MNTKSSSTTLVNKYNEQYAWAVTNVTTRQGKPATEHTLIWAHLYAHTATYGVTKRSPFDTSLPRISASGQLVGAPADRYPWQYCDQCGSKTSWTTNEHARVANTLICRSCNDANAADSVVCPGSGPEFYPDENQWMPCDVCGSDCSREAIAANADVTFDNGALVEACRVCGCSPDTHATVRVDHAYQQGWRNASAA